MAITLDDCFTADPCGITVIAPAGAPSWAGATITVKASKPDFSGASVSGTVSGIVAGQFVMSFAAAARSAGQWTIQARMVLAGGQVETLEFVQTVKQSLP